MNTTLQDHFLASLIESQITIAIYLRHGIKLKGRLVGFDEMSLFLEDEKGTQLILKDAVSTIAPLYAGSFTT